MTRHYCSLWDINYCAKGLALHGSLLQYSSEPFTLHILCMDMDTFWLLSEMKLQNVELIPLESFERALKMEPVKSSRSWQEYCWTCASSLMEYLLPQFDGITYLDADVFFYSDPKVIFDEVGQKSIGIVPHRFNAREHRRLAGNGLFNVGVVVSRSTTAGLNCISRWANQSREWCFNRVEGDRFGDQKYLDSWGQDYQQEVCVIQNLGVNLGPWSVGNMDIGKLGDHIKVCAYGHVPGYKIDNLVCYHFHEFRDPGHLTGWPLRREDKALIYAPYIAALREAQERISIASARLKMRQEIAARESVTA